MLDHGSRIKSFKNNGRDLDVNKTFFFNFVLDFKLKLINNKIY